MIQGNEIIMLLIGIGVLIFVLENRQQLRRFIFAEILILGFYLILAGWILTVLEGFFFEDLLNLVEHACYAGSSVSIALWCVKVFGRRKEGR